MRYITIYEIHACTRCPTIYKMHRCMHIGKMHPYMRDARPCMRCTPIYEAIERTKVRIATRHVTLYDSYRELSIIIDNFDNDYYRLVNRLSKTSLQYGHMDHVENEGIFILAVDTGYINECVESFLRRNQACT